MRHFLLPALIAVLALVSSKADAGPKNGTVMIIRHAEDAESGPGISAAGEGRARFFVSYGWPGGRPNLLVAASSSQKSQRPVLTLTPLSRAIGVPVNAGFNDENPSGAARYVSTAGSGKTTLIAWRHKETPALIAALGAEPSSVLPGGSWPKGAFNLTLVLKFDANGNVAQSRLVRQPY